MSKAKVDTTVTIRTTCPICRDREHGTLQGKLTRGRVLMYKRIYLCGTHKELWDEHDKADKAKGEK